jgi:hypothetical protein
MAQSDDPSSDPDGMGLIMTATIAPPQNLGWLNVPRALALATVPRLDLRSDALHHISIGE